MKSFAIPKEKGLIEKDIPLDVLHSYENIQAEIYPDPIKACNMIADEIVAEIGKFNKEHPERLFKMGVTTGVTPAPLYKILTERYQKGEVSFQSVEVYSIDEYYPTSKDARQSRNYRLHESFLDKVDIRKENIHIPDGTLPQSEVSSFCADYDIKARGMDLLVIGMGEHAQLGVNEPGSSPKFKTRLVMLSYQTRKAHSANFNGSIADTPKEAITMGIDTMMTASKVILMAWGEEKSSAVKAVTEGVVDWLYPASYLQKHKNVRFVIDEPAASSLTRVVSPWLVGDCEWTPRMMRKAVVWLCQRVGKPILKLTQNDYLENSLGNLLDSFGPYTKINIDVFNDLQHTITGWPGGKPGATDNTRPVGSTPFPKKVLIFSPHPDDDVISMGGTFIRLVHQGHDVHVAYQTSGDIAVSDDVLIQNMETAYQLGFGDRIEEVKNIIAAKKPGDPEPKELMSMKAAIRRAEARSAVRSFGLNDRTNAHFLNLPFYESGSEVKYPKTQKDIDIIKDIIKQIKPDQVYLAGDLADPHGTHRICTEAVFEAAAQLIEEGESWLDDCTFWLYRGAWLEWELSKVDMAVPLSPEEVIEKRHAIFRHLSQKDIVPFPGEDPREFWQRAEDRTQNTARLYDQLGMAEYQAIEVFVKLQ